MRLLLAIDLNSLTVLIGPNGSGKTNLLDFFQFISESVQEQLANAVTRRGGINTLLWAGGTDNIYWETEFSSKEFDYEIQSLTMKSKKIILFIVKGITDKICLN